jgi:DNA-binding MarR family transcriptional regulator
MPTGLSPSHAFLMMLAIETPGITQKELSHALHLAPSTVTRFIDTLVNRGYLERKAHGKSVCVFPTEDGLALGDAIAHAWHSLYERYCRLLGPQAGDDLARRIDRAVGMLEVH